MASIVGARRQLRRLKDDFGGELEALFRRGVWRLARRFTPILAVDNDGLRFFVSTSDWIIGRRLFVYHRQGESEIARAFSVLNAIPGVGATLEGGSVVEIGANIGSTTLELLERYGASTVVAIEPDPGNFGLLRQNVIANGVAERAVLLQLALSDHDGSVHLELSDTNSGDHRVRLSESPGAGPQAGRSTIEVRAARLDSLAEAGEVDLDATRLVWLDAQGHEGHILSGAHRLLGAPIPIVMEYWPGGLRRAGGLDTLHELIAEHYEYVIDLGTVNDRSPRVLSARELPQLEAEYGWTRPRGIGFPWTDLILSTRIERDLQLAVA